MYHSAIHIGSRQFQQQERVRVLCENQDDQEGRLKALALRAEDVDGRYGDALARLDRALKHANRAQEDAGEIQRLSAQVGRLRLALVTLSGLVAILAVASLVLR